MDIQPRHRLPVAVGASALVVLAVAAVVLLTGGGSPTPTPTASTPSTATPAASADPGATPEGAVRAFFDAFAHSRQTDDPTGIKPFVTSDASDAYLSVAAFLKGQRDKGKASVLTVQRLDNLAVQSSSDTAATVAFDYTEGGYDIDLKTGQALQSPGTLAPYHVTMTLKKVGPRWLVDSYTSGQ